LICPNFDGTVCEAIGIVNAETIRDPRGAPAADVRSSMP
jgi:hypothetical protein